MALNHLTHVRRDIIHFLNMANNLDYVGPYSEPK